MASKKYSRIVNGIEHGRSIRLAVCDPEEAKKRNEELRSMGVAAEYPIGKAGEVMPLIYRDKNGRKEAHRAFFPDRDPEDVE